MITYVLITIRGRWDTYSQIEMVTQVFDEVTAQIDTLREETYCDITCVNSYEVQTWTDNKCIEAVQYEL